MLHRRGCGEGYVPPGCAKKELQAAFSDPVTNDRPGAGREPSHGTALVGTRMAALRATCGGSAAPLIPHPVTIRSGKREATREAEAGIRTPSGASGPAAGRSPNSGATFASDRRYSTQMGTNDAMAHDNR